MLQSMGLQRVGHDLMTQQQESCPLTLWRFTLQVFDLNEAA